jgi:hypothetical protein
VVKPSPSKLKRDSVASVNTGRNIPLISKEDILKEFELYRRGQLNKNKKDYDNKSNRSLSRSAQCKTTSKLFSSVKTTKSASKSKQKNNMKIYYKDIFKSIVMLI